MLIEELRQAIAALKPPAHARVLDAPSAVRVVEQAKRTFVLNAPAQWWTSLKLPATSTHYPGADGFRHLDEHVAPATPCFLLAASDEDDSWPVIDADTAVVPAILARCSGFEYYLVGHDFKWLVCENDHNEIVVSRAS